MNITPLRIFRLTYIAFMLVLCSFTGIGQVTNSPKPARSNSPRMSADKMAIDSLKTVIEELNQSSRKSDSLYKAEKFITADLRDQILKIDDYRKKLEDNNKSFKGENLKLNQSNRILIIFNSLVAILLVITLVFFLKRLTRKKSSQQTSIDLPQVNSSNDVNQSTRFASFEDRLMQLERLGKLREKGLLSEAEFIAEKQKVLGK